MKSYLKNNIKEEYDYISNKFIYYVRIPALVYKVEYILKEDINRSDYYIDEEKDKINLEILPNGEMNLTLNILKFGFSSNNILSKRKQIKKFIDTFKHILNIGYSETDLTSINNKTKKEEIIGKVRKYIWDFYPITIRRGI